MAEIMKGVVAQLATYTKDGKRIGSKTIFRPHCDYYMTDLRDILAETEFTNPEAFVKEVGEDVARRVYDGEIVEVEREVGPSMELRDCHRSEPFVRVVYPIFGGGHTEDIMRKSLADRLGKSYTE